MLCSFCNNEIARGTGFMYVHRDGSYLSFCCQKCKKNSLVLGRVGKKVKWTAFEHATEGKKGAKKEPQVKQPAQKQAAKPVNAPAKPAATQHHAPKVAAKAQPSPAPAAQPKA